MVPDLRSPHLPALLPAPPGEPPSWAGAAICLALVKAGRAERIFGRRALSVISFWCCLQLSSSTTCTCSCTAAACAGGTSWLTLPRVADCNMHAGLARIARATLAS